MKLAVATVTLPNSTQGQLQQEVYSKLYTTIEVSDPTEILNELVHLCKVHVLIKAYPDFLGRIGQMIQCHGLGQNPSPTKDGVVLCTPQTLYKDS